MITLVKSIIQEFIRKRSAQPVTTTSYGPLLTSLLETIHNEQVAVMSMSEHGLSVIEDLFNGNNDLQDFDGKKSLFESQKVLTAELWNQLNTAREKLEGVKPDPELRALHKSASLAARALQSLTNFQGMYLTLNMEQAISLPKTMASDPRTFAREYAGFKSKRAQHQQQALTYSTILDEEQSSVAEHLVAIRQNHPSIYEALQLTPKVLDITSNWCREVQD